jgi:hypothetical protein
MLKYDDIAPSNSNIQPRARLKLEASMNSTSIIPQIKLLDTSKVETQVILFTPPNPHEMQFFSLTPITLDLSASDVIIGRRRADSMIIDERDASETRRMDILVHKMTQHFPRRQDQPVQGAEILQESISQVHLFHIAGNSRSIVPGNYQIYYCEIVNNVIPNPGNELSVSLTVSANKQPI